MKAALEKKLEIPLCVSSSCERAVSCDLCYGVSPVFPPPPDSQFFLGLFPLPWFLNLCFIAIVTAVKTVVWNEWRVRATSSRITLKGIHNGNLTHGCSWGVFTHMLLQQAHMQTHTRTHTFQQVKMHQCRCSYGWWLGRVDNLAWLWVGYFHSNTHKHTHTGLKVPQRMSDLQWLVGTGSLTHVFNLVVDLCRAEFPSCSEHIHYLSKVEKSFLWGNSQSVILKSSAALRCWYFQEIHGACKLSATHTCT